MKWILPSLLLLISCTSVPLKKVTWSGMPKFEFQNHETFLRSRSIASFDNDLKDLSNRDIYFFALYNQFEDFKILAQDDSLKLGSCPQFHHQLLTTDNQKLTQKTFGYEVGKIAFGDDKAKVYFPELNLQLSNGDLLATSDKSSFASNFKKAMKGHANTLLEELNIMCDQGASDQFYVFENFIRHIKANPGFYYQKESFASLSKIPVVANVILLQSLAQTFNLGVYEKAALARLKGAWVYHYVENLKAKRKEIVFRDSPNPSVVFENALNYRSISFDR